MSSFCRVSLIATGDDRSVLVEDAANPDILLRGLEGGPSEFSPLLRRAWRETIHSHEVSDIGLHLGPNLPYAQRDEILEGIYWLTRRVLGLPPKKSVVERKPPSLALSSCLDPVVIGVLLGKAAGKR